MPIPPEVLFHRYFQNATRHPDLRRRYRGKQDLNVLRPERAAFLAGIQSALNESLSNENRDVPEHVEHPPFHFDYIESEDVNALAFRYSGYSFIGITMPLLYELWDACAELNRSEGVRALLEIAPISEDEESILTVMLQTQLAFMVHTNIHTMCTGIFRTTILLLFSSMKSLPVTIKEIWNRRLLNSMQTDTLCITCWNI